MVEISQFFKIWKACLVGPSKGAATFTHGFAALGGGKMRVGIPIFSALCVTVAAGVKKLGEKTITLLKKPKQKKIAEKESPTNPVSANISEHETSDNTDTTPKK